GDAATAAWPAAMRAIATSGDRTCQNGVASSLSAGAPAPLPASNSINPPETASGSCLQGLVVALTGSPEAGCPFDANPSRRVGVITRQPIHVGRIGHDQEVDALCLHGTSGSCQALCELGMGETEVDVGHGRSRVR